MAAPFGACGGVHPELIAANTATATPARISMVFLLVGEAWPRLRRTSVRQRTLCTLAHGRRLTHQARCRHDQSIASNAGPLARVAGLRRRSTARQEARCLRRTPVGLAARP